MSMHFLGASLVFHILTEYVTNNILLLTRIRKRKLHVYWFPVTLFFMKYLSKPSQFLCDILSIL